LEIGNALKTRKITSQLKVLTKRIEMAIDDHLLNIVVIRTEGTIERLNLEEFVRAYRQVVDETQPDAALVIYSDLRECTLPPFVNRKTAALSYEMMRNGDILMDLNIFKKLGRRYLPYGIVWGGKSLLPIFKLGAIGFLEGLIPTQVNTDEEAITAMIGAFERYRKLFRTEL